MFSHTTYMRVRRARQRQERAVSLPVPDLDWPADLFNHHTPTEEQLAENGRYLAAMMMEPICANDLISSATMQSAKSAKSADSCCACGCGQLHRNNIRHLVRGMFGTGWQTIYFVTDSHKTAWLHKGGK